MKDNFDAIAYGKAEVFFETLYNALELIFENTHEIPSILQCSEDTNKNVDYMSSVRYAVLSAKDANKVVRQKIKSNASVFHKKFGYVSEATIAALDGAGLAVLVGGVVGANTLLGSATLASILGGVFVVSTPVGFALTCAAVSVVATFGVKKIIKRHEESKSLKEILTEFKSKDKTNGFWGKISEKFTFKKKNN